MAASTSALAPQFSNRHGLVEPRNPNSSSFSFCKLNPYSNPVGPPIASWPGSTIGKTRRSLRIHGLFGGKKENNDNGDDAPSKRREEGQTELENALSAMLHLRAQNRTVHKINARPALCRPDRASVMNGRPLVFGQQSNSVEIETMAEGGA
ncbi:hypothetical protein TEA_002223 [Camellia sinensis var. sinensis]|uniref:Uncharacterized protein n=1 Tax=Camellia sinensis var. sinensis TaxID=542762 RepID=A0A4S4E6U3_CAMSN|nr:hypothetical protein TEA_002223 [Camellia sinensis var. sinensis]